MAEYSFRVDGHPVPQPRTRMARLPNGGIRNYDPGTSKPWKELIAIAAKQVRPAAPLRGPLSVWAEFIFARPQSHLRKSGELKPGAPDWVAGKGRNDVDNLFKAPADVLTSIGFWEDDGQVAKAFIVKRYARAGERAGLDITIEEMLPPEVPCA